MNLPRLKIGTKENFMPVYITERYFPTIVVGKVGTGKSSFIANSWQTDHYYKNAKILVDPSSFLARDCYSISGGIYASLDNDVSINPMIADYTEPQICDIIIESINQMVTMTSSNAPFTVKMVDIVIEAIKYCLDKNRRSLLSVLDYVKNMKGSTETRDGVISRLQYLLNDEKMTKLLCGHNSVEWGKLIQSKKTFILDCHSMSKEKMVFAGSLVTNGIKNYFRYSKPKEYFPVSLYIDESHNFVNPSLFDILKEGRKYLISCMLVSQDLAFIAERMSRVMLNSGNIIAYKLGYREASLIAKELDIAPQEIQFIEKYHVAYMTPKEKGIAKALRPVFVRKTEPVAVVEPQRTSKFVWFPLESYPQPESP